ncbi:MAG: signal peptidase II [Rhodothermales bacterium]|jgi:signal peptidase II
MTDTHPPSAWLRPGLLSLGVAGLIVALDQITKLIVLRDPLLVAGGAYNPIPGFFQIVCTYNKGAAGGILQGQRVLLTTISVAAFLVLLWKYRSFVEEWRERGIAASLLLGGIAGNMIDRGFRDGGVVDFLNFYFPMIPSRWFNPWPTFNVADTAICVGVGLYVLSTYIRPEPQKEPEEAPATS